ncbi:hypothetical protein B7P43_G14447 [Cryptotermes secundus]|uniref:MADF domain-containing protein n=1 Tax=Cryptotermes secundus TaxID=105785 RepID=A0A2J7Q6R2_9NEOP|nr:hypothetical protein B7P43_G14447 [Cryptotermes secundus]
MATWSKDFLLEFTEEFRGHLSIWKVKSKEFHNREMKECAYSALTEKVKTIYPKISGLQGFLQWLDSEALLSVFHWVLEDCDCSMQPARLSACVWGWKGRGQTVCVWRA